MWSRATARRLNCPSKGGRLTTAVCRSFWFGAVGLCQRILAALFQYKSYWYPSSKIEPRKQGLLKAITSCLLDFGSFIGGDLTISSPILPSPIHDLSRAKIVATAAAERHLHLQEYERRAGGHRDRQSHQSESFRQLDNSILGEIHQANTSMMNVCCGSVQWNSLYCHTPYSLASSTHLSNSIEQSKARSVTELLI